MPAKQYTREWLKRGETERQERERETEERGGVETTVGRRREAEHGTHTCKASAQ